MEFEGEGEEGGGVDDERLVATGVSDLSMEKHGHSLNLLLREYGRKGNRKIRWFQAIGFVSSAMKNES